MRSSRAFALNAGEGARAPSSRAQIKRSEKISYAAVSIASGSNSSTTFGDAWSVSEGDNKSDAELVELQTEFGAEIAEKEIPTPLNFSVDMQWVLTVVSPLAHRTLENFRQSPQTTCVGLVPGYISDIFQPRREALESCE